MTPLQHAHLLAIRAQLRHGLDPHIAVARLKAAGIPIVAVIRHHLGRPDRPGFAVVEAIYREEVEPLTQRAAHECGQKSNP